ncbi:hypothetical protein [Cryobacterium sp. TMT2-23]|nr:hypothetical protein [Cryobacterium sp. TMT2-23]
MRVIDEPETVIGDLGIERPDAFAGAGTGVLDLLAAVPVTHE